MNIENAFPTNREYQQDIINGTNRFGVEKYSK